MPRNRLDALVAVIILLASAGCGGNGSGALAISQVTITPASTRVAPGGTRAFAYTIAGTSANLGVQWRVVEPGGGSVDATGLYTAPSTPGTYHVQVSSQAAPSRAARAGVTVESGGVALTLVQRQQTVTPGATVPLASLVSVSGSPDTSVEWRVLTAQGGSVDASGSYTAPTTSGAYQVEVTSHADPQQSDLLTIAVVNVTLQIVPTKVPDLPAVPVLHVGGHMQFGYTIQVQGSTNTAIAWSTTDSAGNPIADGASIDGSGNYTAASKPGTYYVSVTSAADPRVHSTATVQVAP